MADKKKSKVCPIILVVLGIALVLVFSIVGWGAYPKIRESSIKGKTRLVEESDTFEKWQNVETPINFTFYIFNWENPVDPDQLTATYKAQFREMGPYVFRKKQVKERIERQGDVLIKYRTNTTYFFEPEWSNGTLDDNVTLPNVPYITAATLGFALVPSQIQPNVRNLMRYLNTLEGERLYKTNVTVREVLFDGWQLAKTPTSLWYGVQDIFGDAFDPVRFGFYKGENNSLGEEFLLHTGAVDSELFGKIVNYNKLSELDWWYTPGLETDSPDHICNKINGTDASIHPPFLYQDKEKDLQIFSDDVCRSLTFKFDREIEHYNVMGHRYKLPANLFDHPDEVEENRCFCRTLNSQLDRRCFKGAFRLFPCKSAPLVGSLPHFYRGEGLAENMTGITPPNADLHETYIDIEPESGALLRARKRIQVSVEINHIPDANYGYMGTIPRTGVSTIMPLFWVEESADMSEEDADSLYSLLVKLDKTVKIVRGVGLGVGVVVTVVSAYFTLRAF